MKVEEICDDLAHMKRTILENFESSVHSCVQDLRQEIALLNHQVIEITSQMRDMRLILNHIQHTQ